MDYSKSTHTRINHPASLFIGSPDTVLDQVTMLLQKKFCNATQEESPCSICPACAKVRQQQHESIIWLCPEKQYSLDDLKIIFSTIAFSLNPDQQFFFVLQKADLLTTICANALLKSLEEPPAGYHFILLANRAELILPTIKSRCIIEYHQGEPETSKNILLSFFSTTAFQDPIAFSKELDALNPSEWDTLDLLDQLIIHWASVYKKSITQASSANAKQAEYMIAHLKKALMQPPMPGSSKLFWKNLFLQIKQL